MSDGLPPIWSIWKEVDPRVERHVKVICHNQFGEVGIATCSQDGQRVAARLTWAKRERFNGKRGGYERVS